MSAALEPAIRRVLACGLRSAEAEPVIREVSLGECVADGVWRLQALRWQTNTVVALRDGAAFVCDPSFTPAEIQAARRLARAPGGAQMHLVITHADEDHVCGIGSFPGAQVLAGVATAAAIADGTAAARLAAAELEWGLAWPGAPRVDRAVDTGPTTAGPFRLDAIDAPGHATDGTAWLLVDERVLLPGDYLSAVSPPLVLGSPRAFRSTLERLVGVLDSGRVETVVPGHGPVLTAAEGLAVGRADLAYLDALLAAAADAAVRGLTAGEALVRLWSAAEPPRPAIPDLAVYDPRTTNARAVLAELACREP